MSLPGNGIFVVQGEMAMLVTAMRRSTRWGSHSFPNEEYDVLMRTFQDLKTILSQVDDLRLLDPPTYLSPFLEVIRSKETTGPVTSLALSAIHKFLSYGLIDPTHPSVPATVEDIADAVTHARFVGTDHSSDGVVLMKILQVLRTLMLSPEGAMLIDESVCEIMLSCFRICFETRLTELLRRNAEQCLRDMTQLIFMRLPQFTPEAAGAISFATNGLSLKRRDKAKRKSFTHLHSTNSIDRKSPTEPQTAVAGESEDNDSKVDSLRRSQDKNLVNEAEITIEPVDAVKSPSKKHGRHSSMDLASGNTSISQLLEKCVSGDDAVDTVESDPPSKQTEAAENPPQTPPPEETESKSLLPEETTDKKMEEYVNHRGIRFTPQEEEVNLQPYGLVCVRELFRFLISLCNPLDAQNTSAMVHLGLCLVGTALEVGADQLADYPSLLHLVKDPLCWNLLSLLSTERISIFALDLQVSFLLFEALRVHLKFQMEAFFKKLIEIISMDTGKATYELKEIHHLALESLSQLFRIPNLCTELYLNYDCDVYSMNVFEEITKLLSKNVVSSTAYNIHSLSLEALMTIIEAIEAGSQKEKSDTDVPGCEGEKETKHGRGGHISLELGGMEDASTDGEVVHISQFAAGRSGRAARHSLPCHVPSEAELDNIRNMKKWVTQGTELFNQKPERGIEFLQEHGVLKTPLDPHEVAIFLRENPELDKKMIGEYICKRSSRGEDEGASVLGAFADSFDFAGLRIDCALRLYLETFRLPGEAPLIFLVMERFAERWHTTNGEPFANTDAAFRLAYAVIMLNMDQHNHNAKKLNVPMTVEDFVKNLRGCNGSGEFDQAMLVAIFHSIKNEEMVMPAERVGPVRDAYLWRVLQRRGHTAAGQYRAAPPAHPHHARLFAVACPPTVTALSSAFERSTPPTAEEIESNNIRDSAALQSLNGLERCAALIARLPPDALTLDTLLLTLCKFTGLLAPQHVNYIAIGVTLGQSVKAQLALRRACIVAQRHADCIGDAWRHLLEIVRTLYIGRLLPKVLVEAEDYLAPGGSVSLVRQPARGSDAGLLSSLYSYIALGETGMRAPTPHEKALIDAATDCVAKCNLPGLLITETKFLQLESLQELIRAMLSVGTPPDTDSLQLNPELEDITIFFLELLGQTLIQNRDRLLTVWDEAGPHIQRCVLWSAARCPYALTRTLTALLRTCARLMRSSGCAAQALRLLTVLFNLPYKLFLQQADVISCGLYELVKTSAQNVHSTEEWNIVFSLLCAAGAGAWPKDAAVRSLPTTSSRSEGSEEESDKRPTSASSESELSHSPQTQGWIMVKNESNSLPESTSLDLESVTLRAHRSSAISRCCEALALVVRDVAHVTPYNCRAAVRCVRLFGAATLHCAKKPKSRSGRSSRHGSRRRNDESSDEEVDTLDQYHMVSIQLLDLMHTLHSRTAQIFKWWREEAEGGAEDYDLWEVAWKPLLQGIAQFCTDRRKQVANSAIAYLQRALLVPGLSAMGGGGWEACFHSVLFPLLEQLPRRADTASRANTIMCKVFLQHLSALSPRPTFPLLWSRIVERQCALVAGAAGTPADDPLTEAALESLKNMILVMDSVRIFNNGDGYNDLWYITWDKIGEFLPNLKEELFPQVSESGRPPQSVPRHLQAPLPTSLPTLIPVAPSPAATNAPPPHTAAGPAAVGPQGQIATNLTGPNQMGQNLVGQNQIGSNLISQNQIGPNQIGPNLMSHQIGSNQLGQNQMAQMGLTQIGQNQMGQGQMAETVGHNQPSPPNIPQSSGQNQPQIISPIQNPLLIPQPNLSHANILPQTYQHGNIQSPLSMAGSPVNLGQSPPATSHIVTPTPVSGMVPIRNPLYDQAALTSSVLLQPLNEMISTQIGISFPSQIPTLYRQTDPEKTPLQESIKSEKLKEIAETNVSTLEKKIYDNIVPTSANIVFTNIIEAKPSTNIDVIPTNVVEISSTLPINAVEENKSTNILSTNIVEATTNIVTTDDVDGKLSTNIISTNEINMQSKTSPHKNTILNILEDKDIEQSELYVEYLTNPYTETKDLSTKEPTLYDPNNKDKNTQNTETDLLTVEKKSLSENTTPMHRNKAQFGSTDNVRQESGIFNFSSYFSGSAMAPGSEVFDTLMSTQEG